MFDYKPDIKTCVVDYSENREKGFFGKIGNVMVAYYAYFYRLPVQHHGVGGRRSHLSCRVMSSDLGWFVVLNITHPYECDMYSEK